ncbi:MAG: BamA/TamA family outer membrane protein [Ignavibacteria bacterium]|nr:BamA/TamA family outer membrane protein [Ignavibacteria bacterium]
MCFPIVFSQTIGTVTVENNSEIPTQEFTGLITAFGKSILLPGRPDTLNKQVLKLLQSNGYYQSSPQLNIDETDSAKITIKMRVNAGRRAVFGRLVSESGDSALTSAAREQFEFLRGTYASLPQLQAVYDVILKQYENQGYPFACLTTEQIHFDDSLNMVNVYFRFSSGRYATIDELRVSGNTDTKDFVIARQIHFYPGRTYKQKEIDAIPQQLSRLKLFSAVKEARYFMAGSNKGVLSIEVKEKNNNTIDGIIGYSPSAKEGESGYFTGLVNLQFRNLFGTARLAAIRWQKTDAASSELELHYVEPWLLGYDLNADLKFFQRQQDSSYVQRQFDCGVDYLLSDFITVGFQLGYQRVIPTLREVPVFTVYSSSSLASGARLKFDSRDDPGFPHSGIYSNYSYQIIQKKVLGPAEYVKDGMNTSVTQQRMLFDLHLYIPFLQKQVVAISLNVRDLRGDMLEQSDFFRIGGTNTVRGYRENQFITQRAAWVNYEHRFLMGPRAYAHIFYDAAIYGQDENSSLKIPRVNGTLQGYGMGLTFESSLGIINVSYALSPGTSFSQGLIHFGLANEF